MNEDEEVVVPKPTEEAAPEAAGDEDEGEETIETVKAQLADEAEKRKKAEDIAENQRIRAEKAEGKNKGKPQIAAEPQALSPIDVIAITRANVDEEDIAEVLEFAAYKKISVSEALKSSTLKSILSERVEERTTAQATHTRGGARGTAKVSGAALLSKASKTGELPETDEGMDALIAARLSGKKK